MAEVYKVRDKWRADLRAIGGPRKRFATRGEALEYVRKHKAKFDSGNYVAPRLIQTFGALADSWIANRIEQSRTPGRRLQALEPGTVAKPYRPHESVL